MKLTVDWYAERLSIPRHYGYSYADFCRAIDIYYPLPINYIARYWRKYYGRFLRFFWRVGLIDTSKNEEFRWVDFFRIKSH